MTRVATILALLLGTLVMLFPFYWMTVTSLVSAARAAESASAATFQWIPRDMRFSNYPAALRKVGSKPWVGFADALSNTIVITTLCVVGQVLSCSLCGYAFARLRFRGRDTLFVIMIATMMLPQQVTMIPLFLLFRTLGWVDTIWPLVVPAFFGTPFFIFMFRQFFAQIPEALVEAARIDGCGHAGVWWRIMLPLCKPVIAITAVFTFISTWNDFLGPLIYLQSEEKMTLAVALNQFQNQYGDFSDMNLLMAASIVTMIPCIVLFFVAQRQFVSGLTLGAVKG
ncbi:MAG: L-arabinose transport system permease protein AraQ [Phycisphaerae bacterium]|nr:L-arabinose transport system permease protein AraQ [Phycisphaerae bacterium]